jgi:hypothetical protein
VGSARPGQGHRARDRRGCTARGRRCAGSLHDRRRDTSEGLRRTW